MKVVQIKGSTDVIDFLDVQKKPNSFTNKKYIPFGEKNLAPQQFAKLSRTVANHRALLNAKTRYISGTSVETEDKKLEEFFRNVNNEKMSFMMLQNRLLFDELSGGNAFFEVVTDKKKRFLQLFHKDATTARISKDEDSIIFNPDWVTRNTEKDVELPLYPYFAEIDGYMRSVVWVKQYEPEFINGIPMWYAGLRTAVISGLVDESNKSELEKGHAITGMLFIPNVSADEAEEIEKKVEDLKGAEHHGEMLVGYYESGGLEKPPRPELIDFRKKVEGNYIDLKTLTNDQLVMIHSWYRSLSGYADSTGFDTERILREYEVALNTYILPKQQDYKTVFEELFYDFGYSPEYSYVNNSPVTQIKEEDVLAVWEWRKQMGMDYDPERPEQQILMYQLKQK